MRYDTCLARIALLVVSVMSTLATLSCGGANPIRTYAYITEATDTPSANTALIAQFQITSSGSLSPLSPATLPAGTNLESMAVTPDGKYLFAADAYYPGAILQFRLNDDGTLVSNPAGASISAFFPFPVALTPDGRFAIVPNPGTLTSYAVGASGTLSAISTAATGGGDASVAIGPTGRFAYVANFFDFTISEYQISADGALTAIGTISTGGSSPCALAVSPKGFLYEVNSNPSAVNEFSIDPSTGALTQVGSFPTGSDQNSQASWVAFDPEGINAYVANVEGPNGGTISRFTVDAMTGALTRSGADVPAAPAGGWIQQVAVDPSGKFAFAVAYPGVVFQYLRDTTGALIPNGTISLGTKSNPRSIAFAQR